MMDTRPRAVQSDKEIEPTTRPRARAWPRVVVPLLNPLAGLLLLGLFVTLLARNDIDAAMGRRALPAIAGGWKSIALVLGLLFVADLGALAWQRGWRVAALPRVLADHRVFLIVGAITLVALGVRVFGIGAGLPYLDNPDEPAVADRALNILRTGDYNPHYFVYPNLYTYMEAGVFGVRFFALVSEGRITTLDQMTPPDFYLWGRLLTALLGALTVPLVFMAGERLFGAAVGIVAATFMALNSFHIANSQFITTDVPATFFTALALVAVVWLLPARPDLGEPDVVARPLPSFAHYLAAGAAIGLAIGTKYNSALVLAPFLVAHSFAVWQAVPPGERLQRFLGARLWATLAAMVVAFLVTTPFAVFDLPNFLNQLASVIAHYRTGHPGHEGDSNWLFYVSRFLEDDTLPTLLTLVGVVITFVRHRREDVLLLAFVVLYYASMSSYRVNFERNMLPILPFTSIVAGVAVLVICSAVATWLSTRLERVRARRGSLLTAGSVMLVLAALVAGVSVLPATASALQKGYLQSQTDNRVRAAQWLSTNVPQGAKIWQEGNAPALSAKRYVIGQGDHAADHTMDWYVKNRYEYLVLNSVNYKAVTHDDPQRDPALRDRYLQFFAQNESRLVASFETDKTSHPGPTILIYRTGYTPPRTQADAHPEHPVSATFREAGTGADIELFGADYPITATAGSALPLTLYWSAGKPLSQDYTVFVHLINGAGQRPAQRDTGPRSNSYPTSIWQPGQVVIDEEPLDLPANLPPGSYTLHIGLYLQTTFVSLPVSADPGKTSASTGPDYVVLGPVTIETPKP